TLLEQRQGERLVSAFRTALVRARTADAVVLFGSEIARIARSELNDLPLAIDAMRRVRSAAPAHVPSLLTLAELCIAQRVWPEAVDALEAVVTTSRETEPKLTALFALASIYEKVLARSADVDRVLRAALALAPTNARALRALLRRMTAEPAVLDEASARARRREVAVLLDRLAEAETDLEARSGVLLELAEVHTRLGDPRAAERSLVMAVATAPTNARAFARLSGFFRGGPNAASSAVDTEGYARALSAVVSLGDQFGRMDARWLAALGHVEITALNRPSDGVGHLLRAVELDPTLYETRLELAKALAETDRSTEAARVLLGMIDPSPHPLLSTGDPNAALELLERMSIADGRSDEAVVVAELRVLAGDLEVTRAGWLRARRLSSAETSYGVLDRPALFKQVLPLEGRHVILEVAAAIAGVESKVLRSDLGPLAIGPRDRVPSRSGHPTRMLLDRAARQLGAGDVELVVAPKASRVRVLAHDVPWVVVPPALVDQPESIQFVAVSRALSRIAYGVPWLEELELEAIEGFLIAAARQVAPGYGRDSEKAAAYAQPIARSLTRRQRRLLEELAPRLTGARAPGKAEAHARAEPPSIPELVRALACAERRTAYVLGGDLLAVIDESILQDAELARAVRAGGPRALAAVLEHPRIGDVVRFALSAESVTLRRRAHSTWSR
ncbi:MAG: hypothetical protein FWD17_15135, partial [Polyangiaceae bacterium]|nr:hypothetical protein [Polyangiaceae bacterium]